MKRMKVSDMLTTACFKYRSPETNEHKVDVCAIMTL